MFAGDREALRSHWEDRERAKKFLRGGTRVPVVQDVLKKISPNFDNELWVDIAPGAGFVQSINTVAPSLFVGIDISRRMLETQGSHYGERIQGTGEAIPLRKRVSGATSIFFSYSDYPSIKQGIYEMYRISRNIISFTDYGPHDEYWLKRQSLHGQIINGKKIVGDINLRGSDEILDSLPEGVHILNNGCREYVVSTSELATVIDLPIKIRRCFVHVLFRR